MQTTFSVACAWVVFRYKCIKAGYQYFNGAYWTILFVIVFLCPLIRT